MSCCFFKLRFKIETGWKWLRTSFKNHIRLLTCSATFWQQVAHGTSWVWGITPSCIKQSCNMELHLISFHGYIWVTVQNPWSSIFNTLGGRLPADVDFQLQKSSTLGSWSVRREQHSGCSDNLFCHRCLFVDLDPCCSQVSRVLGTRAAAGAPGRAGGCSPGGSCIELNYPSDAACKPPPASFPAVRSARSWTWAPTLVRSRPGWCSECRPWPDSPGLGWTQLNQHRPLA